VDGVSGLNVFTGIKSITFPNQVSYLESGTIIPAPGGDQLSAPQVMLSVPVTGPNGAGNITNPIRYAIGISKKFKVLRPSFGARETPKNPCKTPVFSVF
jgi:hypothetical protein